MRAPDDRPSWRRSRIFWGAFLALVCLGFQVTQAARSHAAEVMPPTYGEAIASLPYAIHAPVGSNERSGLTRSDPRSSPGTNVFCLQDQAIFLDGRGQVEKRWPDVADVLLPTKGGSWIAFRGGPAATFTRQLSCLDARGKKSWSTPNQEYHHSIDVDDQGRIVTLSANYRRLNQYALHSNFSVVLMSPQGQPIKEWSGKRLLGSLGSVSAVRLNSVHFLRRDYPGLGKKGDVLVGAPEGMGKVALLVFDPLTGAVRWRSNPPIEYSHDAQVLDNGHILVLDNGEKRGWSRVVELDPATDQIVWEYKRPGEFFTRTGGSVQRLRNGNTLIAECTRGRAFEVTPKGEVVWEWWTPIKGRERDTIFWIRRIEP